MVAVLDCPEMDGTRLRSLAWELEKTGTDLCVAPALLDVAGPRTTIRPVAGLTLMHVDHPRLGGWQLVLKGLFDRCVAAAALVMLTPLFVVISASIWLSDRGPALFTQVRVGKDGRAFRIYKFRTMVVDTEQRRARVLASSDAGDSFDAEDSFLAGLYPQIAEHLAERHAGNYDAEAGRTRFQAWLAKPTGGGGGASRTDHRVNPGLASGVRHEMPTSDGILFRIRKDPRVTPMGALLRRWSIDELPQLFNVFLGDMSLVGPRPALPDEAEKYVEHVLRRLVVKPGITGLWQVNGRSDLSWEESVRLDLRYVENWSFALDLQILWKTISVLLRGPGAYYLGSADECPPSDRKIGSDLRERQKAQ